VPSWLLGYTLNGLAGRRAKRGGKRVALVLNWLLYAGMRDVIVVAEFAERIPAALQLAIRTNPSSAVSTLGDSNLTARRPDIAITRYVFDLAESAHLIAKRLDSRPKIRLPGGYGQRLALSSPPSSGVGLAEWRSHSRSGQSRLVVISGFPVF
jgi:hypothetical protein